METAREMTKEEAEVAIRRDQAIIRTGDLTMAEAAEQAPASLLAEIAMQQQTIIRHLAEGAGMVKPWEPVAPPPNRYENVVAETPYTTVEAIFDRARQMHSATQDLVDALGGLVYGPSPTTQQQPGFPTPTDRFEATLLYMQASIENVVGVASELRRRA